MPPSNVEIVRRAFAAFETRDAAALVAVCSPEIVWEPVTARIAAGGDPYRGHEGMRKYLEDVARVWQELRPVPDRFEEGPDGVVVAIGRVYAWGVGRGIDAPAGWYWRVRDGRIVLGRIYETPAAALEAAGLSTA